MNSLEEFIPHREKVVERPTPPWGRFISPRGKFPHLNDKILGKVNSRRKKAGKDMFIPSGLCFQKVDPFLQGT